MQTEYILNMHFMLSVSCTLMIIGLDLYYLINNWIPESYDSSKKKLLTPAMCRPLLRPQLSGIYSVQGFFFYLASVAICTKKLIKYLHISSTGKQSSCRRFTKLVYKGAVYRVQGLEYSWKSTKQISYSTKAKASSNSSMKQSIKLE